MPGPVTFLRATKTVMGLGTRLGVKDPTVALAAY